MFYLAIQTLLWLILSFLFGLFIGWLIWRKCCKSSDGISAEAQTEIDSLRAQLADCEARCSAAATTDAASVDSGGAKSLFDAGSASKPDDLKMISGVGPKLEGLLNELGIYNFAQVAAFTADDIARVNERLSFTGRIEREQWVEQAKLLAEGEETYFSKKVKEEKTYSS